jgi:hypothetical protein
MAFFNSQALKLAPFSPSKLSTLGRCELQTHFKYILRMKEVDIPAELQVDVDDSAAVIGTALHRISELMAEGKDLATAVSDSIEESSLDEDLAADVRMYRFTVANFQDRLDKFKKSFKISKELRELELAVDTDMLPCSYWDKSAALRGKSDCILISEDGKTAVIIDLKSSKRATLLYAKDQLEFYSLMVFVNFPEVETIRNGLFFLKHSKMMWSREILHRDDYDLSATNYLVEKINSLSESFISRIQPEIKTSPLCNFCVYKGVCKEEKKKRDT